MCSFQPYEYHLTLRVIEKNRNMFYKKNLRIMFLPTFPLQRDTVIASLQLSSVNSSVISSPFVMSPEAGSPASYSPGSVTPPYKALGSSSADVMEQISAKVNYFVVM